MKKNIRDLFQRASDNAKGSPWAKSEQKWLRVENAAEDEATVYIYGPITPVAWYDDEVSATGIINELDGLQVGTIHARINSLGGSVFEGIAIYNLLREHPAKVIVHIDGTAASIAGVIAMCGDEIVISEGASLMLHDPTTSTWGNAKQLRADADFLDTVKGQIVNVFARRTGKKKSEIEDLMAGGDAEETWYVGAEAVEAGFADRVAEDEEEEPEAGKGSDNSFVKPPGNGGGSETPPIGLQRMQAEALKLKQQKQP